MAIALWGLINTLGRKGLQYVREATIRVFWQQAMQAG